MPKYRVLVTVDTTMSCQIEVEADNPEAAAAEAERLAKYGDEICLWEYNDGFASDPYVCDPEEDAEEIK